MKLRVIAAVGGLIALASLSGCAAGPSAPAETTVVNVPALKQAAAKCGIPDSAVLDEGKGLVLDTEGRKSGSGDLVVGRVGCVLNSLEAPAAVEQKMNKTRALDGRQEDSWGNFSASWSYHPDDGLDVIIEDKSAS